MENYKELVGKTKEEVLEILKDEEYRITSEDDKYYQLTANGRMNRYNLRFENNILTKIYIG